MILKASEVRAGDAIVWTDGTVRVVLNVGRTVPNRLLRNPEPEAIVLTPLALRPYVTHHPDHPIICVARNYPL